MKKILIPLPDFDFDPTETAIPWKMFKNAGFGVGFATVSGGVGRADLRMLTGKGLGIWSSQLKAKALAIEAYREMSSSPEFLNPSSISSTKFLAFDGLLLPGGHAAGMKAYLENEFLQRQVSDFFWSGKPIGAICHGVVLAARSKDENGKSILYDRTVTALPAWMEISAWAMTCMWLGNYYRTYSTSVESEVRRVLKNPELFLRGPLNTKRDEPSLLDRGFVVRDRNLLTARWPGDAHRFASEFIQMIEP